MSLSTNTPLAANKACKKTSAAATFDISYYVCCPACPFSVEPCMIEEMLPHGHQMPCP